MFSGRVLNSSSVLLPDFISVSTLLKCNLNQVVTSMSNIEAAKEMKRLAAEVRLHIDDSSLLFNVSRRQLSSHDWREERRTQVSVCRQ